jgi:ABC-type bacteriocin/lantibiotic exporter with double-glycine peptidase domain
VLIRTKLVFLHSLKTRSPDRIRLFSGVTPVLGSAAVFAAASQVMARGSGGLTLGTFLAFNAAFAAFLSGLASFSETGISLLGVTSLWNRARTIIDAEPEIDHATVHQSLRLTGGVKMDRVTFRYAENPRS